MQVAAVSYGLLGALAIALLIAATTDLKRRQIDNRLNAAIALTAPLYWWASGATLTGIAWQLGLCAATFVIALALFAMRQMGGGDVKLLAALALWITPVDFLKMCMIMALIGGAMTVGMASLRMARGQDGLRGSPAAYLSAAVWLAFSGYALFVLAGGTPVALPSNALSPLLVLTLAMALLLLLTFVIIRMMRAQRGKIAVPYGVAIALAALWLLASTHLSQLTASPPLG